MPTSQKSAKPAAKTAAQMAQADFTAGKLTLAWRDVKY